MSQAGTEAPSFEIITPPPAVNDPGPLSPADPDPESKTTTARARTAQAMALALLGLGVIITPIRMGLIVWASTC